MFSRLPFVTPSRLVLTKTLQVAIGPSIKRMSVKPTMTTLDLEYSAYIPPSGNKMEGALIFLHGLFGSKRNFTSLSKAIMKDLDIPVYALDLRNHGHSPHATPMTYLAMAADVLHFIRSHSLHKVTILGHSMGGKVAMSVALDPSLSTGDTLSKLIVVDVAPLNQVLSSEFERYARGMKKIESMDVRTKKEAWEVLESYEPDPTVREFLLTNIRPQTSREPFVKFRIPVDTLLEAVPKEIGSFPFKPGERTWDGPTLFVKGSRSNYIDVASLPAMEQFFPNMFLRTLDAGHWVHGDRPEEFKQLVEAFMATGITFTKVGERCDWPV